MNRTLFLTANLNLTGGITKYNAHFLRAINESKVGVLVVELKDTYLFSKIAFVLKFFFEGFKLKPDVVFCGHVNFSMMCLIFKKLFGVDYVVFTHGIEVWDIRNVFKIKALKNAKKVVTVSSFTKNKLVVQIPELEKKIFLLPVTVDGSMFYPKERLENFVEKHRLRGKKIIFTLNRLLKIEGYKGFDRIVRAMPNIVKEIPEAVYIIGGTGDDIPRIKKLVKEMKLESRVVFAGFIPNEELIDYYNAADVFVMPSTKEGFGTVFIEALACGKPVIAGDSDGSRDALLNGKLGILVDPLDTDEIAGAIIQVLKGEAPKQLYDREYLRKTVLEAYGYEKFKESTVKFLKLL